MWFYDVGLPAALREGLDETLTLKDMKLPEALERTLSTTNRSRTCR